MTSPHEIRTRTFRLATRGYDRVEVSGFLGEVADEMEQLLRELDALAGRVGAAPVATTADADLARDAAEPVIDLRDPFAAFAPRSAPVRRPLGALASLLPPPGDDEPGLDHEPPEPVHPVSTLPPPPVIDLTTAAGPPPPEQLGRQVGEMLRQAELDAAEIRTRALTELEEARRQAAVLRAEVDLESREHVEGVLAEFRATIGRLARAERDARDRIRAINDHLTILLAGPTPEPAPADQALATSIPIGEGSTSTPDAASKAWPTDT